MSTGLEILYVWPINVVLLHLAVLGIIFCFARFPIFGTPRQAAAVSTSDFGLHAIKGRRDASIAKLEQRRHLGEFLVDLQLRRSACASFAKRRR